MTFDLTYFDINKDVFTKKSNHYGAFLFFIFIS